MNDFFEILHHIVIALLYMLAALIIAACLGYAIGSDEGDDYYYSGSTPDFADAHLYTE